MNDKDQQLFLRLQRTAEFKQFMIDKADIVRNIYEETYIKDQKQPEDISYGNKLEYYYCNSCGFEDFDVGLRYSRQVANGELYFCPNCNSENFVEEEDE